LAQTASADPCPTILGCGDDLAWAVDLEDKIADNMWDGQVYEIDYKDGLPRERGNIRSVHQFGDSALWTGTYLASQSFRYAVAKKYIASGTDVAFWEGQRDEAMERVKAIVAQYNVLINISGSWNHELKPSLEQAGFGGGLIKGEPGYLMRSCRPTDAPEFTRWSNTELGPDETGQPRPYTKNRRVFGPLTYKGKTYWCEDGTSRDAYAGVTFGMLTAFDLVSRDNAPMRRTLRDDYVTLANFAFKWLWNTPRPHGRISIPIGSNRNASPCTEINAVVPVCGHDFENFISPLFVITPFARMNLAQGARHVTLKSAGHKDTIKWMAILHEELATQGPMLAGSMEFDSMQPYDGYYKHNLSHLIGYNISTRAPNAAAKLLYKQAVGAMDNSTKDDINAHFETITYALTGETARRNAAVQHLREWRDYRTNISTGNLVNNQAGCGTTIECVPEDQLDISVVLLGPQPVVTIPGTSTDLRARYPLPVAKRAPTDFLWQRPPNQLNGQESALHQAPGIDYLLPYWMLRYHTEVSRPRVEPFPLWPGLKHN
jgi:hypothetical protein